MAVRPSRTESATPGRLTGQAAQGLQSIPDGQWDRLLGPGTGPLKHAYLCAWSKVSLPDLRSRPLLAFNDDSEGPVAACPGYIYELDLLTVRAPGGHGMPGAIRRLFPRLLFARTYELGSPTPLTNPFLVAPSQSRAAAVRSLLEAGIEEGERSGADFILVQNFRSAETPAAPVLSELGFAQIPIPDTAVVSLGYPSFEDYLRAMRAQYRRRARQVLERSCRLAAERLTEFGHLAEELARLWRAVYSRASELKREVLTPEFFRAVSEVEGASVLLMRRTDGSIASFALLLDDRLWLSFLYCGFEREGQQEAAYFRLLYEIIRFGIEQGYRQVDLGMTTLVPKLDVGAVPVPLFAWLRHRNPLFQRVLPVLARGPLRQAELAPRNVFKRPPPSAEAVVASRALSS